MSNQVIHAEWIGKQAKVIHATNKDLEGIEGCIVNETKHLVEIETSKGVKKVPKKGTKFAIANQEISGDKVLVAPEERIKLKVK